jgi:hypothetical protein
MDGYWDGRLPDEEISLEVSGFHADRAHAGRRSPNPEGLYTPVQRNVVLWTSLRTVSCPVPRVRSACGQTS